MVSSIYWIKKFSQNSGELDKTNILTVCSEMPLEQMLVNLKILFIELKIYCLTTL